MLLVYQIWLVSGGIYTEVQRRYREFFELNEIVWLMIFRLKPLVAEIVLFIVEDKVSQENEINDG